MSTGCGSARAVRRTKARFMSPSTSSAPPTYASAMRDRSIVLSAESPLDRVATSAKVGSPRPKVWLKPLVVRSANGTSCPAGNIEPYRRWMRWTRRLNVDSMEIVQFSGSVRDEAQLLRPVGDRLRGRAIAGFDDLVDALELQQAELLELGTHLEVGVQDAGALARRAVQQARADHDLEKRGELHGRARTTEARTHCFPGRGNPVAREDAGFVARDRRRDDGPMTHPAHDVGG